MGSSRGAQPFLASRPGLVHPAVTIVGTPLDLTESFRSGTAAAPNAIRAFSDSIETYSPLLDRDLEDIELRDSGDLDLSGLDMEAALERIDQAVFQLGKLGLPVLLGGEHTLTLASSRALARLWPDLRVLQIDAHLDLIERYEGKAVCHATVFRRIVDELGPERILQVGVRSGTAPEWRLARELRWSSADLVLPVDVREELATVPVYLSIDIDVLDPSAAPGTGCPEPGGPTYRELQSFLHSLRGLRVVGVDVVEVLPAVDPAGLAAVSAAKLVRDSILLFG